MENRPNVGRGIAAGVLALVIPVVTAGLVAVLFGPDTASQLLLEAGVSGWAVFGATAIAVLALVPLLGLSGRGRAIPPVLPLALAALPWVVGVAGMRAGLRTAEEAVASVNPLDKSVILVVALGESLSARALGAWLSSGLFAAVAVALVVIASGRRPENRSAVGLMLGIPASVLIAPALLVAPIAGTRGVVGLLLPALGFALVAAWGSFAAGREAAGVTPAFPFVASVGGALSVLAAIAMEGSAALRNGFLLATGGGAASRMTGLAHAIAEYGVFRSVGWMALGVGLLTCAMVAVWSVSRARPSRLALGGVIGALAVAVLVIGTDQLVLRGALGASARGQDATGISALELPRSSAANASYYVPTVVVTDEVRGRDGRALRGEALRGAIERDAPNVSNGMIPVGARRDATGTTLRPLVEAAMAGRAKGLRFGTTAGDEDLVATMAPELRPLSPTLVGVAGIDVWLLTGMPEGAPDQDPVLWHAVLGASAEVRPRKGTKYGPFPLTSPPLFNDGVVYLGLSDGATVQQLIDVVSKLSAAGFRTVLVPGEIPGHPDAVLGTTEE